jgi:hypothetical protein
MAAHKLAIHGLTVEENHLWNANFPSFVHDIVLSNVASDIHG